MAFLCRVKQSRLNLLHQIRRLHFQSSHGSSPVTGSSIKVLPIGLVRIPEGRISRRPGEFCDNARFFAAPFQPKQKEEKDTTGPRLNDKITGDVVRLVISEDEHVIMSLNEALQRAQRLGMDLVEVNRKAEPPVCKILDFHKEKYIKKLKEKEISKTKTKMKSAECKEIRLTPKIEQKDLEMKAKNAIRSMESGYRVKCTVSGKESEDVGGTLARLCALFEDAAIVESGPRVDRKQAYIVIRHAKFGPSKSGGGKKVSQISVDAFTNVDPIAAEDSDPSDQESNKNVTLANEDLDENKLASSQPGISDSRKTNPSPLPPLPPRHLNPSVVSEDRYKKNNNTSKFSQTKPADGVRPPAQPPNNNTGFPSVTSRGANDTQIRNPRPSVREIPRPSVREIPRQQEPIREPPKPSKSFGVFSSGKTNPQDGRLESKPESGHTRPSTVTERSPKPEKTFGIFSKR